MRRGSSTCVPNLSSDSKRCLEPPAWSFSPPTPGNGERAFGIPKMFGGGFWRSWSQSPASWQVTFKMCCRGLQLTAWSQAWQAIDWKLTPGQLLIVVRNKPQPWPTICCLSTEGTVPGSTLRSTQRACHSVSLMDEEDKGEWSNRDGPQSPQLLVYDKQANHIFIPNMCISGTRRKT